jgi:uncharacterized MAPEG superfamily protein
MLIYADTLLVLSILLTMVVLQSIIATGAHRKQSAYIPGIVDDKLDHFSFVFRSHRTFQNSMENVPLFVLTSLVAIALEASTSTLFWTAIVFTLARLVHMVLFYKIATNKNPSPRSYFFMVGLIAQLFLLGLIISTAIDKL